jgi:TolB protein
MVSCCTGWWVSSAQATFPGANGKLLIEVAGVSTLETLNVDGSAKHYVGGDRGEAGAWSPDGARIAYERDGQIWVVKSNGQNAHSLGVNGNVPTWSPDGTKIAFSDNGTAIKVVNADGSGLTQLTADFDGGPTWSPDGTQIVFHRYQPTPSGYVPALWIMDANGENEALLYDGGGVVFPDWAPDGSKLVFSSGGQVWVIDADGSDPTQLTFDGFNVSPGFSPDGLKIVFTSSRSNGIWTMSADGTQQIEQNTVGGYSPTWQPLHVILSVSKKKARFKEGVTLTARLLEQVTTNAVVSIYATPYGGASSLLVSGAVDANGKLTKVVHLAKRTTFYASWTGDAEHPAGGLTDPVSVRVFPRLRASLTHFDSKAGGYRLYDYTLSCTNHGRGCPTYSVTLTPSHVGQKLHFQVQLFYRGRWRDTLRYKRELPGNGKLVEIFVYGNASIVGLPTRVRSYFDGDADHLPVKTRWSFFKVV